MNELVLSLGLSGLKPVLKALLLPPVPWIVLLLLGAWWLFQRRLAGWLLVLPGIFALWFGASSAVGDALVRGLVKPPPVLTDAQIAQLKAAHAARPAELAIVVLGGGHESRAPEYGVASLAPASLERLRYGLWLARATGIPVAFSGGIGHAGIGQASEAETAARIAAQDFRQPLKWTETRSRDTRENASFTLGLLRPAGVQRIVLVTHAWHMPRARRAFDQGIERTGGGIELSAAPMGAAQAVESPLLRWLPSAAGFVRVRDALSEWLGWLAGA